VEENKNCNQTQETTYKIQSWALRKQLFQEIYATYNGGENKIFSDYSRDSEDFRVKVYQKRVVEDKKEMGSDKKRGPGEVDQMAEQMQNMSLEDQQKEMADREMGFTEVI
jgi:hypothetical protein